MTARHVLKKTVSVFCRFFTPLRDAEPERMDGRIPFDFIAGRLLQVLRSSRDEIGRKVVLPDTYHIVFSPEDRAYRKNVETVLKEELDAVAQKEIKKWRGILPSQRITLKIETDQELETGNFYIDCMYTDKNNRVRDVQICRETASGVREMSETRVPPPGAPEMKNGTFVQTLLNPAHKAGGGSSAPLLLYSMTVEDHGNSRTFYLNEGEYVIGRGRAADIQLDRQDVKLSRSHIILRIREEGMTLRMVGKNGGKINSEYVQPGVECFANSGDKIHIGGTVITLHAEKL